MAYISYKDVPLYFGTSANTTTLPTTGSNSAVFCQQVQLNYTPNIAPVRLLGKTPTRDNFNLAGPPNSSLSFSCYVSFDPGGVTQLTISAGGYTRTLTKYTNFNGRVRFRVYDSEQENYSTLQWNGSQWSYNVAGIGGVATSTDDTLYPWDATFTPSATFSNLVGGYEFNPTDFTGDVGDLGATFRLGDDVNGISGSGAFLTSFSYTLAPYAPVLVQCDFAIYNPLTIENAGGKIASESADPIDDLNFANYGHGAYSTFNGQPSDITTVESAQYQFSANRLPVYEIGGYTPSVVELITAEQSLTIQGDNIAALVPITGSNPGNVTIDIKNSSTTTIFSTPVNGRITAENVSIQGGDLARGNVTITELLK